MYGMLMSRRPSRKDGSVVRRERHTDNIASIRIVQQNLLVTNRCMAFGWVNGIVEWET